MPANMKGAQLVREILIKTTLRYQISKTKNAHVKCWFWYEATGHPALLAVQTVVPTSESYLASATKVEDMHFLRPSNPTPGTSATEMRSCAQETWTRMLVAAWHVTTPNWEQPQCLQGVVHRWCSHTMQYYIVVTLHTTHNIVNLPRGKKKNRKKARYKRIHTGWLYVKLIIVQARRVVTLEKKEGTVTMEGPEGTSGMLAIPYFWLRWLV